MVRTGYGRYCVSLRPSNPNTNSTPQPQLPPQSDHSISTEKEDQTLEHIGVISCQLARHPSHPSPLIPDIGFNFLPRYHGRGYATEAADALMQYYRETRGCRAFAGLTDPDNEAAKKCLSRLGFADRGVRGVAGVVDAGRVRELSVWTVGVGEGAGALEDVGL
jgi:RimJ/RimL family protein N-acetyltransferase